jgi:shikimate kinase
LKVGNDMIIMLFGISNVGKTVTGEKLAQKLNYSFLDMDEEIKKRFQTTLEKFMQDHPISYERGQIKGKLLKDLMKEYKDNIVIAVSPIFYAKHFNSVLNIEKVIAIELQDSVEHIYERIVFSDENDNIYKDEVYKVEHRDYYMRDIYEDIEYVKKVFKKVENKYFIDNRSLDQVVAELIVMIQNITMNKLI